MSARCWDLGAGAEETFPNETPSAGLVGGGQTQERSGQEEPGWQRFRTASQSLKGR